MKKQKKIKKAYTYLTEDDIKKVNDMTTQDLFKEFMSQTRALRKIDKLKKEDSTIADLKKQIKEHRANFDPAVLAELAELKRQIKEIKIQMDEDIQEQLEGLKEKNRDYKEDKGYAKEKAALVQKVLDSRPTK